MALKSNNVARYFPHNFRSYPSFIWFDQTYIKILKRQQNCKRIEKETYVELSIKRIDIVLLSCDDHNLHLT